MKALPGMIHLQRKLRKPHNLCWSFTVVFFFERILLINSMARSTLSTGIPIICATELINSPRNTIDVQLQSVLSKETGNLISAHKLRNVFTNSSHLCLNNAMKRKSSR